MTALTHLTVQIEFFCQLETSNKCESCRCFKEVSFKCPIRLCHIEYGALFKLEMARKAEKFKWSFPYSFKAYKPAVLCPLPNTIPCLFSMTKLLAFKVIEQSLSIVSLLIDNRFFFMLGTTKIFFNARVL